jgi:hypothetical protein
MVTIVWSLKGFHLINLPGKEIKFKTSHYVPDFLLLLLEWRKTHVDGNNRKMIVHASHARPHTARVTLEFLKHNGMKRALYPPYSRDLASSDFYLFGCIKQLLAGHELPDREALLEAVRRILEGIENAPLEWVFLAWLERRERYIKSNTEYVE